jgi:L-amino acid N-acyltransferase YncA
MESTVRFEPLHPQFGEAVMAIFNYYAENSFAAYPSQPLPQAFFGKFLELTQGYPAYVLIVDKKVAGFCFLKAYSIFGAFSGTAEITCFIHPDFIGKGLGTIALERLIQDADAKGIHTILANICSLNEESLAFHSKRGFVECGRFPSAGNKFGKDFDVVWMVKKTGS